MFSCLSLHEFPLEGNVQVFCHVVVSHNLKKLAFEDSDPEQPCIAKKAVSVHEDMLESFEAESCGFDYKPPKKGKGKTKGAKGEKFNNAKGTKGAAKKKRA